MEKRKEDLAFFFFGGNAKNRAQPVLPRVSRVRYTAALGASIRSGDESNGRPVARGKIFPAASQSPPGFRQDARPPCVQGYAPALRGGGTGDMIIELAVSRRRDLNHASKGIVAEFSEKESS